LTLKRSTTFKDPSKTQSTKKSSWDTYNDLPTRELRKLLRPNILRMDQSAIKGILDKIKNEQYINQMQLMWLQDHRQDLRQRVSNDLLEYL